MRKITSPIGSKRVRVLLIHEVGELGVSDAPHFRQAANRARKRLQRLVVGAAGNANCEPGSSLFGPTFFKICPNARNSFSQSTADQDAPLK